MSENWIDAASTDVLREGDVVGISVADTEIALYQVDGEVFATDNFCSHGHARMSDGFLEGREIECPLHQGKFDICTGKALCVPLTEDIRSYPARVENQRVLINLG